MRTKLLSALVVSGALIAPGLALADPPFNAPPFNFGHCVADGTLKPGRQPDGSFAGPFIPSPTPGFPGQGGGPMGHTPFTFRVTCLPLPG
jgi:hypothetical protein